MAKNLQDDMGEMVRAAHDGELRRDLILLRIARALEALSIQQAGPGALDHAGIDDYRIAVGGKLNP